MTYSTHKQLTKPNNVKMKFMFQNNAGYQRGFQLIVSPKDGQYLTSLEIKMDNNPDDSKRYQLTDKEVVELRDLLTSFIDSEKKSRTSNSDIQEAVVVE